MAGPTTSPYYSTFPQANHPTTPPMNSKARDGYYGVFSVLFVIRPYRGRRAMASPVVLIVLPPRKANKGQVENRWKKHG